MGLIRSGPPDELILRLQRRFGLKEFVETGTFRGKTAVWAAGHFQRVTTIEASKEIYDEMHARRAGHANIEFLLGHSRDVLPAVISRLTGPAVFWLDGHWSGGKTAGQGDECPVLAEIAAIHCSPHDHVILIDDAHLFLSPPPPPHDVDQWPTIDACIDALRSDSRTAYIVVIEDVIVAVPEGMKPTLIDYCREVAAARVARGT